MNPAVLSGMFATQTTAMFPVTCKRKGNFSSRRLYGESGRGMLGEGTVRLDVYIASGQQASRVASRRCTDAVLLTVQRGLAMTIGVSLESGS